MRIPLDLSPEEVMKIIERCDGVLLPGSKADVDPAKYDSPRSPHTAAADPQRDTVDELLLQDAYNMRKPILGICYGLQILNVHRSGSLIQDIDGFLGPGTIGPGTKGKINHEAGRKVAVAHSVEIAHNSQLAKIIDIEDINVFPNTRGPLTPAKNLVIPVNSSHHQSAEVVGDGLRAVALSPEDGIIEALEGTSTDHFVLAVQWHPERSINDDKASAAIFRALVAAAKERQRGLKSELESVQ